MVHFLWSIGLGENTEYDYLVQKEEAVGQVRDMSLMLMKLESEYLLFLTR